MTRRAWLLMLAVAMTAPVFAVDRYEAAVGTAPGDNGAATYNEALHGQIQVHDLEATTPADADWIFIQETIRHSYEARVMNSPMRFAATPTKGFVTMNRVDVFDVLLTPGAPTNFFDGSFAARWISVQLDKTPGFEAVSFIKVVGFENMTADSGYEIQVRDTTYVIPRWNNTSSQFTVFLIQNTTALPVAGELHFYDPAGALLVTHPLSVPPYGLTVLNTSSLGALAGLSGSASIAHLGSYGALAGKAVALEPATGFSFDTPLTPIPY